MRKIESGLPGVFIIEPDVHGDDRGYFKETFSKRRYEDAGIAAEFVQDNVSFSQHGVLRGLHLDPRMAKLVQCLEGSIFDVAVDMRENSPSFKKWFGTELTGENHRQLFVPEGFAHGFYVTGDAALVLYKQTALYDPATESIVSWRDAEIGITWPLRGEPSLSPKDAAA